MGLCWIATPLTEMNPAESLYFVDLAGFSVPQEGVEPPTKRLEGSCSIH